MSFEVGQVINNGKVIGRYSRGWKLEETDNPVWAINHPTTSGVRLLLSSKYLNSTTILNNDSMIQNLVLIKRDKNLMYVALENYIKDLFDYYYSSANEIRSQKSSWNHWYTKWRNECSKSQFTSRGFSLRETPLKKGIFNIFELDGKEYRLPVLAPLVIDVLQDNPLFYPHVFYNDRDSNEKAGYAVYKTDYVELSFPLIYEGRMRGRSILIIRDVLIYLHGFIEPYKWHFDIWKHEYNKDRKLFPKCQFEKYTCNVSTCLENGLFEEIHPRIKENCHKYLSEIVTFFESDTTKKLLKPIDRGMYTEIKIDCKRNTRPGEKRLIMRGVSHDWKTNRDKPTIHIMPLTFYGDGEASPSGKTKDTPDEYLELIEVKRYEQKS